MKVRGIGSAPVSFGVYGTAEQLHTSPTALLDSAVEAGYSGMELGPPGFFGSADETVRVFTDRGLDAIGAYVPIHLSADDATVERDLVSMRRTLQDLTSFHVPGVAILADEGSPELLLHPARPWDDRRLALDDVGWARLTKHVREALELADRAGVPTSFHPHISTYVESPWEVDRLLEAVDVRLTVDTGHFWLAGADPCDYLARYGDRVNHVHLKDVRRAVLEQAKAEGRKDFDIWWAAVATPLGAGDVDLDMFLSRLIASDYDGWLVIEQDRLPLGADPLEPVAQEQARNRAWLEAALVRLGAGVVAGRRAQT